MKRLPFGFGTLEERCGERGAYGFSIKADQFCVVSKELLHFSDGMFEVFCSLGVRGSSSKLMGHQDVKRWPFGCGTWEEGCGEHVGCGERGEDGRKIQVEKPKSPCVSRIC